MSGLSEFDEWFCSKEAIDCHDDLIHDDYSGAMRIAFEAGQRHAPANADAVTNVIDAAKNIVRVRDEFGNMANLEEDWQRLRNALSRLAASRKE